MNFRRYIKYLLRILNVIFSGYLTYLAFNLIYDQFLSYLPTQNYLQLLNTSATVNLASVMRDNSIGFRELYSHAFEKSIYISIVFYIVSFLLIEYIYRSKDRQIAESTKKIYEALGAWKERNVANNSNISKENQEYLKEYFK